MANSVLFKCLTAVEVSERGERVWEKLCKCSFPPQGRSSVSNTCFNTDIAICHSILCFLLCVLGIPGRQRCSSSAHNCAKIGSAPWLNQKPLAHTAWPALMDSEIKSTREWGTAHIPSLQTLTALITPPLTAPFASSSHPLTLLVSLPLLWKLLFLRRVATFL